MQEIKNQWYNFTMIINLDLELRKFFIKVARLRGTLELNVFAEGLTKSRAIKMVLDSFRRGGFRGIIIIDGEMYVL